MSYYYVIIAVLIAFKIIFWSFFCYVRNKRYSEARRVIIVERALPRRVNQSDRATIIHNEVVPEPSFASAPPSYADAVSDNVSKPPTYDQAISQPK